MKITRRGHLVIAAAGTLGTLGYLYAMAMIPPGWWVR